MQTKWRKGKRGSTSPWERRGRITHWKKSPKGQRKEDLDSKYPGKKETLDSGGYEEIIGGMERGPFSLFDDVWNKRV